MKCASLTCADARWPLQQYRQVFLCCAFLTLRRLLMITGLQDVQFCQTSFNTSLLHYLSLFALLKTTKQAFKKNFIRFLRTAVCKKRNFVLKILAYFQLEPKRFVYSDLNTTFNSVAEYCGLMCFLFAIFVSTLFSLPLLNIYVVFI